MIRMNENEVRYFLRMSEAARSNVLFNDATTEDAELLDKMKKVYRESGRWSAGYEASRIFLANYIEENGVPGGEYLQPKEHVRRWQAQRETPLIERPK